MTRTRAARCATSAVRPSMKTEEQIRVIELLMKRLDEGSNVDAGGLIQF